MQNLISRFWRIQLFRFLAIGVLNTCFGYTLYLIFIFSGVGYGSALGIATLLGAIFNFFTTGHLVFERHERHRVFRFFVGYSVTYLVNLLGLHFLITQGLGKPSGQAVLLPFVTAFSYFFNKYLVFTERQ